MDNHEYVLKTIGLEQIVEHVRPFEAQYDMRNFRMLCELDCSSYKVILTGEVDW